MRKKIVVILVMTLLIGTTLSVNGINEEKQINNVTSTASLSQPPEVEWSKTYGESEYECIWGIEETKDGGYIACGVKEESDSYYGWLFKIDSNGNEEWEVVNYDLNGTVDGWNADTVAFNFVIQTSDGGYLISGVSELNIEGYGYFPTCFLLKVDSVGTTEWLKRYYDVDKKIDYRLQGIIELSDGYVTCGMYFNDFFQDLENIDVDAMFMKTDFSGNIVWEKIYGYEENDDTLFGFSPTNDNGYILSGWRYVGETENDFRCWMVKTDEIGNIEWENTYGTDYASDWSGSRKCIQTSDGGYIMAGITWSYGNVGHGDVYIIKTDSDGNQEWFETFGEDKEYDICWDLDITDDGGFIFCVTKNMHGTFTERSDIWVIKTDDNCNVQWTQEIGENGAEGGHDILGTSDGGYIVTGHTGKKPFFEGDEETDGIIVKIAPDKPMETPSLNVVKPKSGWIYLFDMIGLPLFIVPSTYVIGDLTFEAEASDPAGIDKVEFFIDGVCVGESSDPPFTYEWVIENNPSLKAFDIKIRASNSYGGTVKEEQVVQRLL